MLYVKKFIPAICAIVKSNVHFINCNASRLHAIQKLAFLAAGKLLNSINKRFLNTKRHNLCYKNSSKKLKK